MIQVFASLVLLTTAGVLTPQQHAEILRVEESLLAPCCYSQSVAQHMSPAAEQMRREITAMVASGKSEAAIVDHYRALYGERILIVPGGETGRVLFALPVAVFFSFFGIILLVLRNLLRTNQTALGPAGEGSPGARWQAFREEIRGAAEDDN